MASRDASHLKTSTDQLHPTNGTGTSRRRIRTKAPARAAEPASTLGADASPTRSISRQVHRPRERKKVSKRIKARSLLRRTWTLPLLLILAVLFLYALNPTESNVFHRFIFLSYRLPERSRHGYGALPQYGKGPWDLVFTGFYTIVLSFTREFVMQEILRPLSRACGIKSRAKQLRFMEQMYVVCYVGLIGPLGVCVMSRTPVWYFNTRGMYESFPHKTHEAVFKFYYLCQAAFWAQQSIVLLLRQEKPRKDFKELVGHHIVTIALIGLSYRFHFTYMGIAIYITHDISDFFLAISKSLNYLSNPLQGPSFALCIAIWIYLRHYINLLILYSILTEFSTVGPYELNWEMQQYKSPLSNIITFALLAALQALNLFWLYCLLRSAYRFVFQGIAKDDRSEAEDEDEPETELDAVGVGVGGLVNGAEIEKEELQVEREDADHTIIQA